MNSLSLVDSVKRSSDSSTVTVPPLSRFNDIRFPRILFNWVMSCLGIDLKSES